jgi:hypothetical protein
MKNGKSESPSSPPSPSSHPAPKPGSHSSPPSDTSPPTSSPAPTPAASDPTRRIPPRGDYQTLLSFQKSEIVYDLTFRFAHKFLA